MLRGIDRALAKGFPIKLNAVLVDGVNLAEIERFVSFAAEKDVEAMKKRGLNVVPVTDAQRAEWQKLTEKLYPEIRGNVVPPEAFDEALRLRNEYRKQHGAD